MHYTSENIARIIRLRMNRYHPKDIAELMGRTQRAIEQLLHRESLKRNITYPPLTRPNQKYTPRKIELLAKQYPSKTYKQIAKDENITQARLSYLMAKRAHLLQQGVWLD